MRSIHLLAVGAALSGLLTAAAAEAGAQQRSAGGVPRVTLPPTLFPSGSFGSGPLGSVPPSAVGQYDGRRWDGRHHHRRRFHGGHFPGFILVEREVPVIIEREVVVREVPAAAPVPPAPPPPPRKPYVIGKSYASLPGGCMKLIEGSVSYYRCDGEWYRQVGSGGGARYKAVARRL